jgi:hypothetical protein
MDSVLVLILGVKIVVNICCLEVVKTILVLKRVWSLKRLILLRNQIILVLNIIEIVYTWKLIVYAWKLVALPRNLIILDLCLMV